MGGSQRWRRARATLVGATAVAVIAAGSAQASWTKPQKLTVDGYRSAIASNARGDAVAAFADRHRTISVARARAGRPFGERVRIAGSANGYSPRVAIDARGVVLIVFAYLDGTREAGRELRDDGCCEGAKVSVWRPRRRPTRGRAVLARGILTTIGPLANAGGRRGVLVSGRRESQERDGAVRFAPINLAGRVGRLRTVADGSWTPLTLQFARGRAVAGLAARSDQDMTELATAVQRPSGAFVRRRPFARFPALLHSSDPSATELAMTADGRGGQVAVWQRGKGAEIALVVGRKPLTGRLRTTVVRRGAASRLTVAVPAVAPDGSIAVAWGPRQRLAGPEAAYVLTRSATGRTRIARLPGDAEIGQLAVAVAPAGNGAVAVERINRTFSPVARIIPLRRGIPRPGDALGRTTAGIAIHSPVLTANARDPARALVESGFGDLYATRLR